MYFSACSGVMIFCSTFAVAVSMALNSCDSVGVRSGAAEYGLDIGGKKLESQVLAFNQD